jgi:hypothetical protein
LVNSVIADIAVPWNLAGEITADDKDSISSDESTITNISEDR